MKNFSYEVSKPKLIYIFKIPDASHEGLLKIGETTFKGHLERDARKRIDSYTRTAGIKYELLHTALAVTDSGDAFRDCDVHQVLMNSGIKKKSPAYTNAREWFKVELSDALEAIAAVKHGESNIKGTSTKKFSPTIFRDEQLDAINTTVSFFKKKTNTQFLWNAKMRFGKTLCALEVVRRLKFDKTIIVTHRPIVNAGWYEDFRKIFGGTENFRYGNKLSKWSRLFGSGKHIVYFASIQDLRGSKIVGGDFDKNTRIFETDWDCVIVDEAHEGTQTALGDTVIKALVKPNTKFLALSGTPFNIIDSYDEDSMFTWDYVMEQRAKADWEKNFPDMSNPYAELPQINIFTYDLGKLFNYVEDKSFNFREFFRTDDENFVHADDVKNFLNLLTTANNYPYANENFRDTFRHTLWIVPGVKEGRALSNMLQSHKVFHAFKIVNVAGDGDSDDEPADALTKVRDAIKNFERTITLSCGKLTAGVTVPEWTAVFMLAGSYSTSAMNYLQTIFRVQSPCRKRGVIKENCYVFDFAPDRTLKVVAESVAVSTRAGKTTDTHRQALAEFFNFCPVIAMQGSRMETLDADKTLRQIKRVYAERIVRNGFDDNYLYNDELLKLDELEIEKLNELGKIIGKGDGSSNKIVINAQGLTDAETKKLSNKIKRELTPEEKDLARRKRNRLDAIKILRGISIRMPLLIYGADVPFGEDIRIEKFADLIDDASWAEFMPKGVTKKIFAELIKYYDPEIFIEAGNEVRKRAKDADDLPPLERIKKIVELFATFKNPDKETVLTPWRVVNIHLDAAFDEKFFTPDKIILEINSKSGLYPLCIAQKIFGTSNEPLETQRRLWNKIVAENIFVICKTPMAVKITRRTLAGYRGGKVNAEFFNDLIPTLKHTPSTFIERISDKNFWHKGAGKMFFDAVVGNPPYQISGSGDNKNFAAPVYDLFLDNAFKLADKASLITPARFLSNAGATPVEFRRRILANPHLKVVKYFPKGQDLFPTSDIKGGVAITLYDANENFGAIGTFIAFEELDSIHRKVVVDNPNFQPFSKIIYSRTIYKLTDEVHKDFSDAKNNLSDGHLYDMSTNIFNLIPQIFFDDKPDDGHEYIQILGLLKTQRVYKWIRREYINNPPPLTKFKVTVPDANGSGALGEVVSTPLVGSPLVGSPLVGNTETFISVGAFDTRAEADACIAYIKTKFCRVMLGVLKVTQHNPPATWAKVPLQDFTSASDIDWSKSIAEIDLQLYRKYKLSDAEIKFIEDHVKAMT